MSQPATIPKTALCRSAVPIPMFLWDRLQDTASRLGVSPTDAAGYIVAQTLLSPDPAAGLQELKELADAQDLDLFTFLQLRERHGQD